MPIYELQKDSLWFPEPQLWPIDNDIVAIGGDLNPDRLLVAYQLGIFPWNEPEGVLLWWNPIERAILSPKQVRISRSSRNIINQQKFTITFNRAFSEVIRTCMDIQRPGQDGTWITDEHVQSFIALHSQGVAHSVEAWQDGKLVGGLYGLSIGGAFFGESMFSKVSNASKICFIILCQRLEAFGYEMIDCQIYNPYLGSLGAFTIQREAFSEKLKSALHKPTNASLVFDSSEQF